MSPALGSQGTLSTLQLTVCPLCCSYVFTGWPPQRPHCREGLCHSHPSVPCTRHRESRLDASHVCSLLFSIWCPASPVNPLCQDPPRSWLKTHHTLSLNFSFANLFVFMPWVKYFYRDVDYSGLGFQPTFKTFFCREIYPRRLTNFLNKFIWKWAPACDGLNGTCFIKSNHLTNNSYFKMVFGILKKKSERNKLKTYTEFYH